MKTIFLFLATVSAVSCHLVPSNQTKSEVPSTVATENETTEVDSNKSANEKKANVKVVTEEKRVYLEDVFYSLKNQNWTKNQELCLNQTLQMLTGLKNFSLWAVWEWDSISSEPVGLLYGNHYQLGNFDECMSTPWQSTHPELSSQYCLADVNLESQSNKHPLGQPFDPYSSALDLMQHQAPHTRPVNVLKWGVCTPATCDKGSVERLLTILLLRSHLGTTGLVPRINITDDCQIPGKGNEYDAAFYGFFVFVAVFLAVCLVCSYIDASIPETSKSLRHAIIRAFSIPKNSKNLLEMKKDGIEFLYGIRFLTICLIVADHQIGYFNGGPVSDGRKMDSFLLTSLVGPLLLHNDLFVDTFFYLSGFLVVCSLMNMKRQPSPWVLILRRYFRLVVAFAVVLFYLAAVYAHTGSGPLWPQASLDGEFCRRNWWLNLLMLGNYIHTEEICSPTSWYIPCDFHYFCITVLLFWIYGRNKSIAYILAAVVAVAALVLPGIVNYTNDLPAVQLFTYEFVSAPRKSKQFNVSYIKSHTRMGSYVVGLAAGYIFTRMKKTGNLKQISKNWSVIGVIVGLLLMLTVMLTGSIFVRKEYTLLEGSIFATLERPIWAFGLSIVTLCCAFGSVPLVKTFLSWYPWVPLSRLSYGLYLTHTVLIARNIFIARNPGINDSVSLITMSLGVIFWCTLAAYGIWLLFEAPINNLLVIMLTPRNRVSHEKKETTEQQPKNNGINTTEVEGHYSENLPNPVKMLSKF